MDKLVLASGNAGKLKELSSLLAPLGIEVLPHPLTIGRTAPTQIHRHVEDGARNDLHQLALWSFNLVVQTSQRTLAGAAQLILHEIHITTITSIPTTMSDKLLLTK